jgi:hypothetical protein
MRKLILASVLLLATASAHAGELRDLALAASDTPAATEPSRPLPPVSAAEKPKQEASEPARPLASKQSQRAQAERYEAKRFSGNEAKARRIAAKYGISW